MHMFFRERHPRLARQKDARNTIPQRWKDILGKCMTMEQYLGNVNTDVIHMCVWLHGRTDS